MVLTLLLVVAVVVPGCYDVQEVSTCATCPTSLCAEHLALWNTLKPEDVDLASPARRGSRRSQPLFTCLHCGTPSSQVSVARRLFFFLFLFLLLLFFLLTDRLPSHR